MDDPPPPHQHNYDLIKRPAQHERDLNRQINQAGVEGPGAGVSCGDAESGGLAAVDESGPPFPRRELRVAQVALLQPVRVREARQWRGMWVEEEQKAPQQRLFAPLFDFVGA